MRIVYHKQVIEYLNQLVDVLYEQGYFGFKEDAYDYVDWILDRIEKYTHTSPSKLAPEYFSKYGANLSYIKLKRNAQTTWCVFFNQEGNLFHIRLISNNHIIAKHL